MHYSCIVLIDRDVDTDTAVEEAMAPFEEHYSYDEQAYVGFWDWYQIGGRWTGTFNPLYDPEQDSRNRHPCKYCEATGIRNDAIVKGVCNVCRGTGKHLVSAIEWVPFAGDRQPVPVILSADDEDMEQIVPYFIVYPDDGEYDYLCLSDTDRTLKERQEVLRTILSNHPERDAVMVDCHN